MLLAVLHNEFITLRLLSHTNTSDSSISPELPTQEQRPAGSSTAYVHNQKTIQIIIPFCRTVLVEVIFVHSFPPPLAAEYPLSALTTLPWLLLQHLALATASA